MKVTRHPPPEPGGITLFEVILQTEEDAQALEAIEKETGLRVVEAGNVSGRSKTDPDAKLK